ncbi:unnamed protein product [Pleuronectes platessa]|uniref:Uncharacterized protein n=1 Tax=Pleuronectes platessa TaxID=8262 RepID=A0A9N7YZH9_PLEPL|nr:unnamed protein product [Pleuronectes platessa]
MVACGDLNVACKEGNISPQLELHNEEPEICPVTRFSPLTPTRGLGCLLPLPSVDLRRVLKDDLLRLPRSGAENKRRFIASCSGIKSHKYCLNIPLSCLRARSSSRPARRTCVCPRSRQSVPFSETLDLSNIWMEHDVTQLDESGTEGEIVAVITFGQILKW